MLSPKLPPTPMSAASRGSMISCAARGSERVLTSVIVSGFVIREIILKPGYSTQSGPELGLAVWYGGRKP